MKPESFTAHRYQSMATPEDFPRDALFPTLSAAQIARLDALGSRRKAAAGEVLFDRGATNISMFVVVEGGLEVMSLSQSGENNITVHHAGQFSGEANMITGRPSLVRTRAASPSELIEIDRVTLQRIVQTDPELSEVFLGAFLRRRAALIAQSFGDIVVIGSRFSSATLRLKEFLSRNGHPYSYLELERDPGVQGLLEQFGVDGECIPVLICRDKAALRNPTNAEVAACLGFNTEIDESQIHDLIVVGAGPAGLAAAVYAASEGLDVLVLEGNAPGGQAGTSSRIENYLGFPTGISGQDLAGRAFIQAEKFGAHIAIARTAGGLLCQGRPFVVECTGAEPARAHTLIVASGAEYRRLPVPNLAQFEGVGVYYGATRLEGQLCGGEEIVIVGGGNSAGQAAVFLAGIASRVHILVRGAGLAESMSRYLIRRIEESPNISLLTQTEIVALEGNGHLEKVTWRNNGTGRAEDREMRHVFSMTGASPNTAWLNGCIALDDKGFVKTGADLTPEDLDGAHWPLNRPPFLFETSVPRIFAVGDVRSRSVKRVASAVGEGSVAVQLIHRVLSES